MPKTTSIAASRILYATAKAYEALADMFQDSITAETDGQRLFQEAEAGLPVWQEVRHMVFPPSMPSFEVSLVTWRQRC